MIALIGFVSITLYSGIAIGWLPDKWWGILLSVALCVSNVLMWNWVITSCLEVVTR
jgi:hypothetical protein